VTSELLDAVSTFAFDGSIPVLLDLLDKLCLTVVEAVFGPAPFEPSRSLDTLSPAPEVELLDLGVDCTSHISAESLSCSSSL